MGDNSGNTPLMFARDIKCVNLLLGAGAMVDKANTYGRTPLHFACIHSLNLLRVRRVDLVKFLLKTYKEKGIDINAKDNFQRTAKWIAESIEHKAILKFFEEEEQETVQ